MSTAWMLRVAAHAMFALLFVGVGAVRLADRHLTVRERAGTLAFYGGLSFSNLFQLVKDAQAAGVLG